jgi:hypothetical protein
MDLKFPKFNLDQFNDAPQRRIFAKGHRKASIYWTGGSFKRNRVPKSKPQKVTISQVKKGYSKIQQLRKERNERALVEEKHRKLRSRAEQVGYNKLTEDEKKEYVKESLKRGEKI